MLFAHPKGQPFGCPFCSTSVACGLFCLSLTRRAKKLPPEVFLYALSNPFGCYFVPIKRRDSIRAPAGAWSLAVTTLHRSVALCRSSFESLSFGNIKRVKQLSLLYPLNLAESKGFDSHACGRLVARGHNAPPERCSVPLVLQIPNILIVILKG